MSKSRLVPPTWFWITISICMLAYLTWFLWPAWYVPAAGAACTIVANIVGNRRALRKKMDATRALLELQLDAMLQLVKRAGGESAKLEKIVRYNTRTVRK